MRFIPILLVPVCVATFSLAEAKAKPVQAATCGQTLEKEASLLIFDLTLELEKHNSLSAREYSRIQQSLQTLENHIRTPQALSCFRKHRFQKERYQEWLRLQSHKVITRTTERLHQVCARQTRIFVTTQKLHIDSAVAKNRLARAAKLATKMEQTLRTSPMMSRCPPTQRSVDQLLENYLPEVKNQAALPKVRGDMVVRYVSAKAKLDAAFAALETTSTKMIAVPNELDTKLGSTALAKDLEQCSLYAGILKDLGAKTDSSLSSELGTLGNATEYCRTKASELPSLLPRIVAHNNAYKSRELQQWQRRSIKGWGMEKVFNSKGRPIAESQSPSGLLWVFSDESVADKAKAACTTYRFSSRGKLLGNRSSTCPQ